MEAKPEVILKNGLDLQEVLTRGSILNIAEGYREDEELADIDRPRDRNTQGYIGRPVKSFSDLEKHMTPVGTTGFIKKKIIEEGGGLPLHKECTVTIAFTGYLENATEPFDVRTPDKPMVVDLNDNGLLPGLQIAIDTMLVGETSLFLLSYQVMYGELGILNRIKPKATCAFYIKLMKSILTPKKGKLDYSEPNSFQRIFHEVKLHYASGATLYKHKNYSAAVQLFRRAVFMLHRCRLANELEQDKQEKMLKKLYLNLAICYNAIKQPLKACIACNELNRFQNLWNNEKALFQNAKSLRMIGEYDAAEKRLRRAIQLCPENRSLELKAELDLLYRTKENCNQSKLIMINPESSEASQAFKKEVDDLIKNFKENVNLCKLTLPGTLNVAEVDYIKEACTREKLFFNKIQKEFGLDKEEAMSDYGEHSMENLYESSLLSESCADSVIDVSKSEPDSTQ